jgi:hypothetical protein
LIWISLLDFFRISGEDEVVFVTSDTGFRKNTNELCKEFKESTGKNIIIKNNDYYKSLSEAKEPDAVPLKKEVPLPDVNRLRKRINEVICSLCGVATEDYWGSPDWNRTFTLNQKVDGSYMEHVFAHLKQVIKDNLLESEISADKILGLDDRVVNGVLIPMSSLECVLSLYEEILQNSPEYIPQFYSATATIINGNYEEPRRIGAEDDELLF